ncbi:hypothetical protein MBBAR_10c00590 [Methanobrevibacter arboriphilus JCM 13429 = DSM 1125]|uniref:Uncharacterized protein n=1 Tax=Methanobrevibacter arboriphilus JCM 13429 = DSM 1125 TaxID=1300164 RepID=A0A1V6N1Z2_METAZ|nr:hypothetical protein [Methanobrevibacter arboriphilus]OQD58718.1 hypothetical protein MBBAR_10c00590 [Methanobrevibacter arboriphilus JCM 13429 = DSM 1125]
MLIKFTHGKNYIKKPSSFARDSSDEINYDERLALGTTLKFNNPNISIKGIKFCHECHNDKIRHVRHLDIVYCEKCGLVLRQGLEDYTPLESASFPVTSIEHKNWKAKLLNDRISVSMDKNF